MARARNIKPGFFKNEDLAECSLAARLCFAGLWTMADREGRLEDRPKRIKGELFAYDTLEVEPLLAELAKWGFIRRYTVAGERFILITKFVEHQVPHGTEKDGSIPDEAGYLTVNERGKNGYITGNSRLEPYSLTVKTQEPTPSSNDALTVKEVVSDGGQNTLNPESGFLNPESLNPLPPRGRSRRSAKPEGPAEGFDEFYAAYPRKIAKIDAIKAWNAVAPGDELRRRILASLEQQQFDHREGGRFIPYPASWLNAGRWEDEPTMALNGSEDWTRSAV